jgi:hypothetical protein
VKRGAKYLVRVVAALLLAAYGPALVSSSVAYAAAFSGCEAEEDMGCITRTDTQENKTCVDTGELSQTKATCVSCSKQANHICTWCGGDLDGYFNPAAFPSCDTGGG